MQVAANKIRISPPHFPASGRRLYASAKVAETAPGSHRFPASTVRIQLVAAPAQVRGAVGGVARIHAVVGPESFARFLNLFVTRRPQ